MNNKTLENTLRKLGFKHIAGVDEVNIYSTTGEIIACAVVLKTNSRIRNVNDSKKLTRKQRETIYKQLKKHIIAVGIGRVLVSEIDKLGFYQAHLLAKQRAVVDLTSKYKVDVILLDGKFRKLNLQQYCPSVLHIVNGDEKCYIISCASIIAKVLLDRFMERLGKRYKEYGFEHNTGVPTKKQVSALRRFGMTKWHRKVFTRKYLNVKS